MTSKEKLDSLHHVAVTVKNIQRAVDWYKEKFSCEVIYQDQTWAFLQFENVKLALVVAEEHPSHVAFEREDAEKFGALRSHRDGTQSIYIQDSEGNPVEILKK